MDKLQMFFQLTKVDPVKGIVSGIAVQEVADKSGEIFDYATSKAHFESWSGAISKATDGENLGNVREMHNKSAVGKLTAIDYDDDNKLIRVTATIVDEGAKKKLAEKVYTGFSIGGRYLKKWADPDNKDLTRYTAGPSEISLVDNPCVPGANFTMVKADGTEERVEFTLKKLDPMADDALLELSRTLSNGTTDGDLVNLVAAYSEHPLVKALGAEADRDTTEEALFRVAARDDVDPSTGKEKYGDVEFADEKNKKYPIDTEAHIRAAWNYFNKPKNAGKYDAGDAKTIKGKIVAAWKKKIDKDGPPSAEKAAGGDVQKDASTTGQPQAGNTAASGDVDAASVASGGSLTKSMSQVCCMANAIESLCYLRDSMAYEASREMDGSPLVAQIEEIIGDACELLRDLTDEETSEIEDGAEYFAMAAQVGSLRKLIDPAAAPASVLKAQQVLQMGGEATKAKLEKLLEKYGARHSKVDQGHLQAAHDHLTSMGAVCTTDGDEEGDDGEKLAGGNLTKALAAKDELIAKLTNDNDSLRVKLQSIPKPAKPTQVFRVVEKAADGAALSEADLDKAVADTVAKIMAMPEDKRMQELNRRGILRQLGQSTG